MSGCFWHLFKMQGIGEFNRWSRQKHATHRLPSANPSGLGGRLAFHHSAG
jgi:hypothetical protein